MKRKNTANGFPPEKRGESASFQRTSGPRARRNVGDVLWRIVRVLSIITLILCFTMLARDRLLTRRLREANARYAAPTMDDAPDARIASPLPVDILDGFEPGDATGELEGAAQAIEIQASTGEADEMHIAMPERMRRLAAEQPDAAGWLTAHAFYQMDFPVLQRDNTFYLDHDAAGEPNEKGAAFLDEDCVTDPRDQTLIIYAHNLASGELFGSLFRMGDASRLARDPLVTFSTLTEEADYVPLAVLRTSVGKGAEDFPFFQLNFAGNADFMAFIDEAKSRSTLIADVDCAPTDALLTLVTCADARREDRVIALLRRLRPGEDAASFQGAFRNH